MSSRKNGRGVSSFLRLLGVGLLLSSVMCRMKSRLWLGSILHRAGNVHSPAVKNMAEHRAALSSLAGPEQVSEGMRVRVLISYEFEEGEVPEYVELKPGIEFVCGRNDVAPQLEAAVCDMVLGETRNVSFPADSPLFGPRDATKVVEVPLDTLQDSADKCKVGELVSLDDGGGQGVVLALGPAAATIDLNHPLAGKPVSTRITLTNCKDAVSDKVRVKSVTPGDGVTYPRYGDILRLRCVTSPAQRSSAQSAGTEGETMSVKFGFGDLQQSWEEGIGRLSLGERATIDIPAGLSNSGSAVVLDVEILGIQSELDLAF